jgi:hypothetical protein
MGYTKVTRKSLDTPGRLDLKYSLVEVDSSTGDSDAIYRYVTLNPSEKPELEYLRRPSHIPTIGGEAHHAVSYSRNGMEKIFEDKETRDFAFRVHDAGDHLFLVVEQNTSSVLLQRVAFDDSVNLKLEEERKEQIKSQEAIDYAARLKESVREKDHYGWIPEVTYRCDQHDIRPYILVPCLVGDPIQWVVQGKLIHGNGRLCC